MLGPYLPYPFVTLSNMPCPCQQVLVCEVFLHLRVLLPGSDDFFSQMGVVAHQGQIPQGHNCTQQCPNWSGQQKSFCYLFPLLSSIWDSQSVGPWGNAEDQKTAAPVKFDHQTWSLPKNGIVPLKAVILFLLLLQILVLKQTQWWEKPCALMPFHGQVELYSLLLQSTSTIWKAPSKP